MPLAKRIVKLVRKPVPPDKKTCDPDSGCHRALVDVLRLLSSIVVKADQVFGDIAQECQEVVNRTERLTNKVTCVSIKVNTLNARSVSVPVSDLLNFSQLAEHYKAEHGFEEYMFTAGSRPDCIHELYQDAVITPLVTIRRCNIYRTDGKTGSKIFSLPTMFKEDSNHQQAIPELDDRPPPHVESFQRPHKAIREARSRPRSLSTFNELDVYFKVENLNLPTPDDKMRQLSRSQPITLVPIDISGTSFDRLCEHRASIRSINREYEDTDSVTGTTRRRRHRRRQTVSGIPSNELNLSGELQTRSASRERWERPRSMHSLEHYGVKMWNKKKHAEDTEESSLARSCSLRRSLRSLFKDKRSKSQDLWAEGRPLSPGPPVVDLNSRPLKRSLSLPRSLKSLLRGSSARLSNSRAAPSESRLDVAQEERVEEYNHREPSSKYGSLSRFFRRARAKRSDSLPRSQSHHASLYTGTSTFIDGASRPKSMEIPTLVLAHSIQSQRAESLAGSGAGSGAVGQQGRTLQVACIDQPWAKPFATVRLRPSGKVKAMRDDRQSSSGHWSLSTGSARQSLESHNRRSVSSVDKDSALCLSLHSEERCPGDQRAKPKDVNLKENIAKMSASDWLRSMSMKLGRPRKRSSTIKSGSSDESLTTHLTQQNLKDHDYANLPYVRHVSHNPDEESSIYSVDQEGFYTSMHKDCGVHKSNGNITDLSPAVKALKMPDSLGMRAPSFTVQTMVQKKAPPPPVRTSSILSKLSKKDEPLFPCLPVAPPVVEPQQTDLSFEFDAEAMCERLQAKTIISSALYPSLCSVTPMHSDEEDEDILQYSNAWRGGGVYPSDSLKSTKSAPGTLQDSGVSATAISSYSLGWDRLGSITEQQELSPVAIHKSLDDSVVSDSSEARKSDTSDGFSTWPRSPKCPKGNAHKLESILKIGGGKNAPRPPRTLNFAAAVNVFDAVSGKVVDTRQVLPVTKTPEDILEDKRVLVSVTHNSFRGPAPDSGVNAIECSRCPSSSSLQSSSASSEDQPPNIPDKYQHKITVKPRVREMRPSRTPAQHVYANVIVDNPIPSASIVVPMPQLPIKSRPYTNLVSNGHVGTWPRSRSGSQVLGQITAAMSKDTLDIPASVTMGITKGYPVPQAAPARLVISSPVADTAQFVENPHKRSLCSPVTTQELLKFSNYNSPDKWYNELPRNKKADLNKSVTSETETIEPTINALPKTCEVFKDATTPVASPLPTTTTTSIFNFSDEAVALTCKPVSQPLFPSISAMKHSISFQGSDTADSSATYKSWYEGTDTADDSANSSNASTPVPPKMSFNTFLKDGNHLSVPWRYRRDSNASSISTISSSSGKRTFASIRKPSMSSLTHSIDSSTSGEQADARVGAVPADPPVVPALTRSVSNPETGIYSLFRFHGAPTEQVQKQVEPTVKRLKVIEVITEDEQLADRSLLPVQPEKVVQSKAVPVQPEKVVQPKSVPVQPEKVVQPKSVPVQPEKVVQPKAVPVQPEKVVQPKAVPVQPEKVVQPKAVPVQPEKVVQSKAVPVQPEKVVQPKAVPVQPEKVVQPKAVPVQPEKVQPKAIIKATNKQVSSIKNSARVTYPVPNTNGVFQMEPTVFIATSRPVKQVHRAEGVPEKDGIPSVLPHATLSTTLAPSVATTPATTVATSAALSVTKVCAQAPSEVVVCIASVQPIQDNVVFPTVSASVPTSPKLSTWQEAPSQVAVVVPQVKSIEVEPPATIQSPLTPVKFNLPKLRQWPPPNKTSVYNSQQTSKNKSNDNKENDTGKVSKKAGSSPTCKKSMSLEPVLETSQPSSVTLYATLPKKMPNQARSSLNRSQTNLSQVSSANLGHSSGSLHKCLNSAPLSTSGLAKSTGNLSHMGGSPTLGFSSLSLAKSTESLHTERTRSAKLSFLSNGPDLSSSTTSLDDRFAKYSVGKKTASGSSSLSASRTSLSNTADKKPLQGRFVSCMINQLHKQSVESLSAPSPASSSSALGSAPSPASSSSALGSAPSPAGSSSALGSAPSPASSSSALGSAPSPASSSSALGSAPSPASSSSALGSAPSPASSSSALGSAPSPAGSSSALGSAPSPASSSSALGSAPSPASSSSALGSAPSPASSSSALGSAPSPASSSSALGSAPSPASSSSALGSAPSPASSSSALGSAPSPASSSSALGSAPSPASSSSALGSSVPNSPASAADKDAVSQVCEAPILKQDHVAEFRALLKTKRDTLKMVTNSLDENSNSGKLNSVMMSEDMSIQTVVMSEDMSIQTV